MSVISSTLKSYSLFQVSMTRRLYKSWSRWSCPRRGAKCFVGSLATGCLWASWLREGSKQSRCLHYMMMLCFCITILGVKKIYSFQKKGNRWSQITIRMGKYTIHIRTAGQVRFYVTYVLALAVYSPNPAAYQASRGFKERCRNILQSVKAHYWWQLHWSKLWACDGNAIDQETDKRKGGLLSCKFIHCSIWINKKEVNKLFSKNRNFLYGVHL